MGYSSLYGIEGLRGLSADVGAEERARRRKIINSCNDTCKNIAGGAHAKACADSGLEPYARSCDEATGTGSDCGCRKPRVTATSGPPIRIAPSGGGYGGIIPRSNTLTGLSATTKLPGRMAANAWCAKRMSCLNGRKPIATDIKNTWEMTTDDCSCLPESTSFGSSIRQSGNTLTGLSATTKLPGRMAANAWCAQRMSCLNGRKPIATDIKNTWEMTTDDCSCLPESTSFGSSIRQSGNTLVPRYFVMPRLSAKSRNRAGMGYVPSYDVTAIDGLGESFLESIGSLANLAIVGLAIYGGFCLAKKL